MGSHSPNMTGEPEKTRVPFLHQAPRLTLCDSLGQISGLNDVWIRVCGCSPENCTCRFQEVEQRIYQKPNLLDISPSLLGCPKTKEKQDCPVPQQSIRI
jgi:hypothetical protein